MKMLTEHTLWSSKAT